MKSMCKMLYGSSDMLNSEPNDEVCDATDDAMKN